MSRFARQLRSTGGSEAPASHAGTHRRRTGIAVAADLDRATDSQWDWVAEHTRTYLLIYGMSGDGFVVVASKGGADENPEWFKNLQADPGVGSRPQADASPARLAWRPPSNERRSGPR